MRFTLIYRGQLPTRSRASAQLKQHIRRQLHPQLEELWQQFPLYTWKNVISLDTPPSPGLSYGEWIYSEFGFKWAPLVNDRALLVAGIDVRLFRRGVRDQIDKRTWDIDNRIKTLFDALRKPCQPEEVEGDAPRDGEVPFYCVLEDDRQITRFSVSTERLLEAPTGNEKLDFDDVLLVIDVTVMMRTGEPIRF